MPIHVYISGGENRSRTFWKGKNYSKAELKMALRPYGVIVAHSASNKLDYIVLPPGVSIASNSTLKKASNVPEISWSQFESRFLSSKRGDGGRRRRGGAMVNIRSDRSWEEADSKNSINSLKKLVKRQDIPMRELEGVLKHALDNHAITDEQWVDLMDMLHNYHPTKKTRAYSREVGGGGRKRSGGAAAVPASQRLFIVSSVCLFFLFLSFF
jgi:hypothetical protein